MGKDLTYEPEAATSRSLVRRDADSGGGQVVPFTRNEEPVSLRESTFEATGTKRVNKAQEKILTAPPNPTTEVAILPTGELYPPQVAMRRRLARAFGPMGWSMRPLAEIPRPAPSRSDREAEILYREYALVADGRVVATAIGSGKYYGSNARMDYSDVAESLKSDALKRCCKDLNMLSELWDPQWCREWRNEYGVHVFVAEKSRKSQKIETVDHWRRIDAEPFHGELEPVRDSPNQAEWRKQSAAWRAMLDAEAEATKIEAAKLKAAKRNLSAQRHDLEDAGGNPRAAVRQPEPATRNEPIDVQPERAETVPGKPEATARDSRAPVSHHAPRGVLTDDKPYLIRSCKIAVKRTANGGRLYAIEMMDGQTYFTFSDRVYANMQDLMARRVKILIQHETQKAGGKQYRHITEWQEQA